MTALIDTNVLVAHLFRRDANHTAARQALVDARQHLVVAAPSLVELSFLLIDRLDYGRMVQGIKVVRQNFQIEPLNLIDMVRMEVIMEQYQNARFDYTDTAIMALGERLNITQIYTFDRRDFSIFRPTHYPSFELLP